jgi:hypothetical protein
VEVLVAVVHVFVVSHLPWFTAMSVLYSVRSKALEDRLQSVSHRHHSIRVTMCSANDEVLFVRASGDVRPAQPPAELAHDNTVSAMVPQRNIPSVCVARGKS